MPTPFDRLRDFLAELKRRRVYRVAVTYVAVAFLALQAANLLVPTTALPAWADDLVVFLAVAGFPLAVVLAWAFEITPEGVRRTESRSGVRKAAGASGGGRTLWAVAAVLVVAAAGGWLFLGGDREETSADRSLAVLPFSETGGEESAQFARGIHDDLLTRLSGISGLRVTSRTSVRQYGESSKTIREIGEELGVGWVVEGSVRQARDRVRVTAQLIEAGSDTHVWADSYDRELTAENVFAIQDDLTRRIASALQVELTAEELDRLGRAPTESLEAYRFYAQGLTHLDSRTETGMRRALVLFRQAVREDSSYAPAWAGIAAALYELRDYGHPVPDGWLSTAERAADRALELDPRLPEAHVARGVLLYSRQAGPAAICAVERAVELRPNDAEGHRKLAWMNQILGRPDAAHEAARTAVELDPLSPEPHVNLAMTLWIRGDGPGALREARRTLELQPGYTTSRFYEGVMLHQMGRHAEAVDVLRGLSVAWAGAGPEATLALALAASGDRARARTLLEEMTAGGADPFLVGLVHAALGEEEAAFDAFGRVERWDTDADWPILAARYLYPDPLDRLRDDPRYREMIRGLNRDWGLPPDGEVSGCQGAPPVRG